MKTLFKFKWGRIFLSVLALALITDGSTFYKANQVFADTTGWVEAAIDAKDTKTIQSDLEHAKAGMIHWKATSGNAYIATGTPASDMTEVNKNLDTYIARAAELNKLDRSSTEYQNGLSDLNTSFAYFSLNADDYWLRHQGLGLYLLSEGLDLSTVASFVAMVSFFVANKRRPAIV